MRGAMRLCAMALAMAMALAGLQAVAKPIDVIGADRLLPYLEAVIAWERSIASVETTGTARESLLKDALTQSATNATKSSFDFARTQAEIIDKQAASKAPAGNDDEQQHLADAATKVAAHIADLTAQTQALQIQIAHANRKTLPNLKSKLADLAGQLKLAMAQRDLIGKVLAVFNNIETNTDGGMLGKVNSLADTALTASKPVTPAAPAAKAAVMPMPFAPGSVPMPTVSGGLLDLGKDIFTLLQEMRDVRDLDLQTAALRDTNKEFLDKMRAQLRAAAQIQAPVPATPPAAGAANVPATPPAPAAAVENFDDILATFNQLAAGIVPLTQSDVWLESSARTLDQWTATLKNEMSGLLRQLAIRLAILCVLLLIPIAVSEVARRATDRYVRDEKRNKQLRAVRRTLLIIAIVIIVIMNLISQVTSFATFAGFLTAGLAVAFQNVLLSVLAHFFFYGRYSVRAGDRVSVSGVIGDVVQIGMVRFYIRELEDKDGKLEPTGRVAAFPNSIMFQTSAFFKYV
jgi:hypothetical protein